MKRVLIVEDVPEMRGWLTELMARHWPGLKVDQASNSFELRSQLERARPDFVLLDEILGAGPGEDLAALLEWLSKTTHCVVLMTGMDNPDNVKILYPTQVIGRLTKPDWEKGTGAEEFIQELEKLLTGLARFC